jgi:hypothetical protein
MRLIAAFLLVLVLAIGGGLIATTAYQAGLQTAITTSVGSGAVVAPVVVPYGVGWHGAGFGFGIFGLFATLFFLFIVFALLRAAFFRGSRWHGGWGPRADWADHGHGSSEARAPWESHARETFDTWHRLAHDTPASTQPDAAPRANGGVEPT